MNYNYHTHTYLCNHAMGTPEEYVLKAIDSGIVRMGFSDHMPHRFKNGLEAHYRVPVSMAERYVNEVNALKEKYKDKIDIILGFEMEYFEGVFDDMLQNARSYGAKYLIYGGHYTREEGTYNGTPTEDETLLKEYVSNVISAINTGVYTYIAHPDLINFKGDEVIYRNEMIKICNASGEKGIPLEINFLGIRTNRHYPNENFWALAGEVKCPVTFGFDAHDPDGSCDMASLPKAMQLVEKYSLNYIGEPRLIYL